MRKPEKIEVILSDPKFWPAHPDPQPVCTCECHEGKPIFCSCFGPCCDLTGEVYIDKDGNLNHTQLAAAIVRCNPRVFGPVRNIMVLGELEIPDA